MRVAPRPARVAALSSLAYERVCVLFNIGALQSALAAQQPLDTEDSLKLAARLLQVRGRPQGTFADMFI